LEITVDSIDQLRIDTPEQIALELPLAGIGSRFLAMAIDTLLQVGLYAAGGIIFGLLIPLGASVLHWFSPNVGFAIGIFLIFSIYWGYFALFELFWKGQTPGKRVAGIRVIKESGRPINAFDAVGRNLMRAVDSVPGFYGIGLVCMMLNKQNRRLGDFVAGTVVVHDKLTQEIKPTWTLPTEQKTVVPQISQVTPEDVVLIETYLHRRWDLEAVIRIKTAVQIAERIKAKTGLEAEPNQHVDDFLEGIVRQARDTAGYRQS
jgi:uncharacterized RDD family membrane protein YckC